MKKPFISAEDDVFVTGDDDEKELEAHGKGLVIQGLPDRERPVWLNTFKKYYCSKCKNGMHNTPDNNDRCKRKGCECKCQTYYIGKDGKARPYGTPDDSFEEEIRLRPNPEYDTYIEQINELWRKSHPESKPKEVTHGNASI